VADAGYELAFFLVEGQDIDEPLWILRQLDNEESAAKFCKLKLKRGVVGEEVTDDDEEMNSMASLTYLYSSLL
jgi:hypothetical protein